MILGIDFDTRAVHCVLLDDDTNHARYLPVPFVDHKPPFRFDDARNVSWALGLELSRQARLGPGQTAVVFGGGHFWDDIHLVGIEKPYCQSKDSAWKYGLVVGQILSCIPRSIPVLDMPPNDRLFGWKALSVSKTNATKDDVRHWVYDQLWPLDVRQRQQREIDDWPQDAFDAYCLARAARRLNEQAVDAA